MGSDPTLSKWELKLKEMQKRHRSRILFPKRRCRLQRPANWMRSPKRRRLGPRIGEGRAGWKAVIDGSNVTFEDPRIAQSNDVLVT